MTTIVLQCTCKNTNQDALYGKNKRVFNKTTSKSGESYYYRCTVCLKERLASERLNVIDQTT